MTTKFAIGRSDGRSNARVIVDVIKKTDVPGTLFTYQTLIDALNENSPRQFKIKDIQGIVRQAVKLLEKDSQRTLTNVRGAGYRIAFAKEHSSVALVLREKGDRQIKRGLSVLKNVRWDELDDNQRRAHEGTLLVTEGMYQNLVGLRRRQSAIERALESLKSRVDSMASTS